MDTTVHGMYRTADAVRHAVHRLLSIGIDRSAIEVITCGEAEYGSFAEGQSQESEAQLTERVGSFADVGAESHNTRDEPHGSFAEGQSQESEAELTAHVGSWAGVEPVRLPHHELKGRLAGAGLNDDEAAPYLTGLPGDNIAVLARVPHAKAAEARRVLHP